MQPATAKTLLPVLLVTCLRVGGQPGFEVKGSLPAVDMLYHCYQLPGNSFRCIGYWWGDTGYVLVEDFSEFGVPIRTDTLLADVVVADVLLPLGDGGCYVAAYWPEDPSLTVFNDVGRLLRFNAAGDTMWTRDYGLGNGYQFHGMRQTGPGKLALLGSVALDSVAIDPDTTSDKFFLAFVDTAGALLDTVVYPITTWGIQAMNTPFHYHEDVGFFMAYVEVVGPQQYLKTFLMITNDSGHIVQKREMYALDFSPGVHVVDPLTGFLGYVPNGTMKGYIGVNVFGFDYWSEPDYESIALLKHDGVDTVWVKRIGTRDPYRHDQMANIIRTSDGNLLIAATWNSRKSFHFNTDADYWLTKVDTNGNVIWERRYGDSSSQELLDVIQTSDGGFLMNGIYAAVGTFDHDYYLIKTDSNGVLTHINGLPVEEPIINAFPNPAQDQLNLTWQTQEQPDWVMLTDITGRMALVSATERTRNYLDLDISRLPSGMYLCTLSKGSRALGTVKVVKQ